MMPFRPDPNDTITIADITCTFTEHPAASGMAYGQAGRRGTVYQLTDDQGQLWALKVFLRQYREPRLVGQAERIQRFEQLPGLKVSAREVLTASRYLALVRDVPDLTYAVFMRWVDGKTWLEYTMGDTALPAEKSLELAQTLAGVLVGFEERGLAHCDLSGPNVMLTSGGGIELVDLEEMYGPDLLKPEFLPGGSPGYAHKTAPDGLWNSRADRFSGAVLLSEMLGWADERVVAGKWGEGFFDPDEMGANSERYRLLLGAIKTQFGPRPAELLESAWHSETLAMCPTFSEWLGGLAGAVSAGNATSHAVYANSKQPQEAVSEPVSEYKISAGVLSNPKYTAGKEPAIPASGLDLEGKGSWTCPICGGDVPGQIQVCPYCEKGTQPVQQVNVALSGKPKATAIYGISEPAYIDKKKRPANKFWPVTALPLAAVLIAGVLLVGKGLISGNPSADVDAGQEGMADAAQVDDLEGADIPAVAPGEVLRIGQLSFQSGVLKLYGDQQVRGFELGLEYASGGERDAEGRYIIAGRPVEVIIRDTEGNPDTGAQQAVELIEEEGVEILQGGVSSGVATQLTAIAEEYGVILMIEPAASAVLTGEYFNPYVFRTSRTSYDDTLVIVKYLVENVGPTFAHIGIEGAFGEASGAAIRDSLEIFGGEMVAEIYAPFGTNDFTPYIAQAMDSGADNLLLTWAGTGYVDLYQQLADLGALDAMTVGTGFGDNTSFTAVYGAAMGEIGFNLYHYTVPDTEINDWLIRRHLEEYGEPPDLYTAGGMASALALAEALGATGGDASASAMIPALEDLSFEGPKGTYHIRPEDHVCEQPMNILRLVNLDPDLDGNGIPEYDFFETIHVSQAGELNHPCLLQDEYLDRCGDLSVLPGN